MLGYSQTSSAVFFQEPQEVFASYKVYLTRNQRLSCYHVGLSGYRRPKSQYLASFGNPGDQRFSIARTRRQLHASGTNHKDSARRLTFNKQHCSLREDRRVLERFEFAYELRFEVAKIALGSHRTVDTTLTNFQTVWRVHSSLHGSNPPVPTLPGSAADHINVLSNRGAETKLVRLEGKSKKGGESWANFRTWLRKSPHGKFLIRT